MKQARPTFTFSSTARARRSGGFTLLEIIIAAAAASLVLICIYGLFSGAVKMRDNATAQNRELRLRARATSVIRNDLKNALISGGILASTLMGDSNGTEQGSSFPGYLKMTTTGGKDVLPTLGGTAAEEMYGDVQQVEYYIVRDPNGTAGAQGGDLVRVITRDLLDSNQTIVHQEQVLSGVQSFQVSFYDGAAWQTSWMITGSNNTATSGSAATGSSGTSAAATAASGTAASGTNSATPGLPAAIRVDIQMAGPGTNGTNVANASNGTPPMEIIVPWTTAPFLSGTNFSVGSDTTQ